MDGGAGQRLADRAVAIEAAVEALRGLRDVVHEADGPGLTELLGRLDEVATLAAAGRVVVTGEALTRGEIAASQCATTTQWVESHAPSTRCGGAAQVARAATVLGRRELGGIRDAVECGRVTVPLGLVVVGEFDRLRGRVIEEAHDLVVEGLLSMGERFGARGARDVRPRLLAEHGLDGELQTEQDSRHRFVHLSHALEDDGVFDYQLRLDAEGRAALEAAIGPLSAPFPVDGAADTRTTGQRRGEALVAVCRRSMAAGDGVGSGLKATLFVTMGLDDLQARSGGGVTTGSADQGALLGPETVRKLACDGGIVPTVLGSAGEVLDLGRRRRLFSPGQLKALWVRDRHCTFPGCSTPAHWCDAHHVLHWLDGGRSDLGNAALLCGRHHTVVHRDRLIASVSGTEVVWDRLAGSYDRSLEAARPRP